MTSKVLARCFNGKTYELSPAADATVGSLQAMISKESGIDADRQTLLFNRAVLSDPSAPLSSINIPDGATVSVVRRVGKAAAASSTASRATPAAAKSTTTSATGASKGGALGGKGGGGGGSKAAASSPPPAAASGGSGAAGAGGLEEMMRSMGLGAGAGGAGGAGAGGPNPAAMQQMQQMMQMLGGGMGGAAGGGLGGAPGGAGGGDMMAGIQNMMQSLFSSPAMQEYLNDPEKQEQSRQMLASNPLLTQMMGGADMEAAISDPAKWQESMNAARQLVSSLPANAEGAAEAATGGAAAGGAGAAAASKDAKDAKDAPAQTPLEAATAAAKASPRDGSGMTPPPGVDMDKLSLAYGHALGQSLVNSGLGLDPRRVVVGFEGSALHNKEFPMPLPEYERQMGVLQNVATEYLARVNMEDATRFFEEAAADSSIRVLEAGRVLIESGEVAPDASKPAAAADATVLVLLQGRLLDGRFFYTYPSADESGENVHPLTLPLAGAPPALTAGLIGMHEGEERTLYVHPSASEGMADMFGDLLPPNALLIFDLELVSASAPEEETADAPAATDAPAAPATAAT